MKSYVSQILEAQWLLGVQLQILSQTQASFIHFVEHKL